MLRPESSALTGETKPRRVRSHEGGTAQLPRQEGGTSQLPQSVCARSQVAGVGGEAKVAGETARAERVRSYDLQTLGGSAVYE